MSSPLSKPWTYRELEQAAARGAELDVAETALSELPRLAEFGPGRIRVRGRLELDEQGGEPRWSGRVDAVVTGECQRCLEPVVFELDVPLDVRFVAGGEADDGVWAPGDGGVGLADVIEEQVLLAMPLVIRHDNGDCEAAQVADSIGDVGQSGQPQQRPFAGLSELLAGEDKN